jgi:antitoxin MazE
MTAVKKWGNSLAVRIPAHFAQQLNLTDNTPVDYAVVDGSLVIRPVTEHGSFSLKHLLDRITAENIHGETETGAPVGQEIW